MQPSIEEGRLAPEKKQRELPKIQERQKEEANEAEKKEENVRAPMGGVAKAETEERRMSEGARELARAERERQDRLLRVEREARPSASVEEWLSDVSTPSEATPDALSVLQLGEDDDEEEGDAGKQNAPPTSTPPPDLFAPLLNDKAHDKEASGKTRRPLPHVNGHTSTDPDAITVDSFFHGVGATASEEARLQRERERQREAREAELRSLEMQREREEREIAEKREAQRRREEEEARALAQRLEEEQRRLRESQESHAHSQPQLHEATPSAIFDQPQEHKVKARTRKDKDDPLDAIFGSSKANKGMSLFDDDDDDDALSLASAALKSAPKSSNPFAAMEDDDDFDDLFNVTK